IIDLIDVVPPEAGEVETFNDVYLVMPKMETTLAKVIRSKQKLTDRHFQFFMYQILRGLKYMHSAGVIHRDLKPENILVNGADCDVKITDFGLARGVCKDEGVGKPTEYVVTRWYRSPEVMCSAGLYDEAVDIWSVGCMLGELILRRPLFPGQNYLDQLKIIFETMGTPKDMDWIKTPEAKRWVQKLKPHDGKDLHKIFEKGSEQGESNIYQKKKKKGIDPTLYYIYMYIYAYYIYTFTYHMKKLMNHVFFVCIKKKKKKHKTTSS
ncbi:big map kinase/bmk, partial [Reticulomyxa filosa]